MTNSNKKKQVKINKIEETVEEIIVEEVKDLNILNFNISKKKTNFDFLAAKFKIKYNVDFIEENKDQIIFTGTEYKVVLNKI